MVQLLVKDLRITRKFIAIGFVFVGFFFFALGSLEGVPLAVPAIIFGHFLTVTASKMDEKNNNGMLLASFPVNRWELVTSKYLSLLMFIGVAFVLTTIWHFLGAMLLPANELPRFTVPSCLITLTGISVFYSIYLPMYFGLGARLAQVLDLIVMFTLAGFGLAFVRILDWMNADVLTSLHSITSASLSTLTVACIGLSLLLLGLSWTIAVYLYERKDY